MNMKTLHLIMGGSAFVVFLGTGIFMGIRFPEIYGENETIRFLFRANHVYILFSSLLNVMAAFSFSMPDKPSKKILYNMGSWLLMISSPLFLAAFIVEPLQASAMRPLTLAGAFACLQGVGFHAISSWRRLIS